MLIPVLEYVATNKVVLVGAAITISELVTISVNLYRRLKAQKKTQVMGASTDASFAENLLWAANPVNLFRKA